MLGVIAYIIGLTFFLLCLSHLWEKRNAARSLKLTTKPLVSILIPAYKSEEVIEETLLSLKNSTYPRKEIIVVNDSPGDGTAGISHRYGARVIENQERSGKANALNRASKTVKGEFILFLDSDTVLKRESLSTLVASYQDYESRGEKVGVMAPRYTLKNREKLVPRITFLGESFAQAMWKIQMAFGRGTLGIRGCCLLIRKSIFSSIGGFKQTLTEDAELSLSLLKLGYRTKYEPRALASTMEYETLMGFFRHINRSAKGMLFTFFRHMRTWLFSRPSMVSYVYIIPLTIISWLSGDYSVLLPVLFSIFILPLNQLLEIAFGMLIPNLLKMLTMTGVFIFHLSTLISREVRIPRNLHLIVLLFIVLPFITLAFLRGFLSAIWDKLLRRPELRFKDWRIS